MAKAKCRQCGTFVNSSDAIKGTINGKNAFWCSEKCKSAYEEAQSKAATANAEYDEIIVTTKQICGYEIASYSLLRKEINAWEKLTTRQNIISYLKENKEWLSGVMSKSFDHEFGRIKYFSVVISSKLHDYKPKVESMAIKPINLCGVGESNYKPRKEKRGLEFLEED